MSKSIIVAVDETELTFFKKIVDSLDNHLCMIKIGSASFNSIGHEAIEYVASKGFKIFLDLKFHDIPNTVKKSIEGLTTLPICMMTVHISGGIEMMKAAKDAVYGKNIKIFGVTALTSLSHEDTFSIFKRTPLQQVEAMLNLAQEAGIDGVVCSPHELELVAKRKSLLSITPGIRLSKTNDDQSRVMSPKEAILKGANFLVIGRPITSAKNIMHALKKIHNSI
tara:strand:+ start:34 stop:702 length:669 start_codon:yes stop_codon:yes gene_type:complete